MSAQYQIPPIPRVISPSPTPSETSGKDGYFPPQTRSKKNHRKSSVEPIKEYHDDHKAEEGEDPELHRARSRSRSPQLERNLKMTNTNGSITTQAKSGTSSTTASKPMRRKKEQDTVETANGTAKPPNDFLSPDSAYPQGFGSAYWRNLSRSPSPLGLIPIHREWRAFIHKHEVPRKLLHVCIGFVTLYLYRAGFQRPQIHPVLLAALIPIFTVDLIRFRWRAFNRLYIKLVGAFMRESEAHDRFNGVIAYLAGAWAVMRFCQKDVAVVSVLLLSWCDTAASTFGRMWGKYTPRIRRGKTLAGSLAACTVGLVIAVSFWGFIGPSTEKMHSNISNESFAFTGTLMLPTRVRQQLGLSEKQASIDGSFALCVISVVTGLVASVSEAIDLWDLDDNLTIPILSGLGLGGFLWAFGGS